MQVNGYKIKLSEEETMELIQEGMVGLLEAAESYAYERGVAFSLFATYRIKGSMLNGKIVNVITSLDLLLSFKQ